MARHDRHGPGRGPLGLDLMYFPATYSFFPVWNVGRLVVTMHDTLPLSHPELVFPRLGGRIAWRLKEAAAARWADRIVTVSEASRRAIEALVGLARPEDPRHHRRPRPDLPAPGREPEARPSSAGMRTPAGRAFPALRGRPQPAQEPAPAGRGVRAVGRPDVRLVLTATSTTSSTPASPRSARRSSATIWVIA